MKRYSLSIYLLLLLIILCTLTACSSSDSDKTSTDIDNSNIATSEAEYEIGVLWDEGDSIFMHTDQPIPNESFATDNSLYTSNINTNESLLSTEASLNLWKDQTNSNTSSDEHYEYNTSNDMPIISSDQTEASSYPDNINSNIPTADNESNFSSNQSTGSDKPFGDYYNNPSLTTLYDDGNPPIEGSTIVNASNGKVHKYTCHTLPQNDNRYYFDSEATAREAGYTDLCGNCHK